MPFTLSPTQQLISFIKCNWLNITMPLFWNHARIIATGLFTFYGSSDWWTVSEHWKIKQISHYWWLVYMMLHFAGLVLASHLSCLMYFVICNVNFVFVNLADGNSRFIHQRVWLSSLACSSLHSVQSILLERGTFIDFMCTCKTYWYIMSYILAQHCFAYCWSFIFVVSDF